LRAAGKDGSAKTLSWPPSPPLPSSVGCKLVAHDSWHTDCPETTAVIGLKELTESEEPLPQTHIQFAHCYKHQAGWSAVLKRFRNGGGTLYDLEFLQDENGRRVAAFGFHAGFAGAAAGCLAVGAQQGGGRLGGLKPYKNEHDMVDVVKGELAKLGRPVRALVIGALGRCGSGAVELFRKVGLKECVSLPYLLHLLAADDWLWTHAQGEHPQVGHGGDV
jgi:saccharopine dehydrogenase (NAD+, L-lysine-forming)